MTTNYINFLPLVSNIDTLKARGLQSKDAEISVSVKMDDLLNGVEYPVYYASRYGMIYNPNEEFKPNVPNNHKLPSPLVDDYHDMLPKARIEYKRLLQGALTKNVQAPNHTSELEELKQAIEQKQARINEQSNLIGELRAAAKNAGGANSGQTERMEALIEMQMASIKALQEMQPQVITIKMGNKETKISKAKARHEKFEKALWFVANDRPLFLSGPAGAGKSEMVKQMAEAAGLEFYPISAISQEYKLTGFLDMKSDYKETMFYKAMKYGGLLFLDEMDACLPEVLVMINSAIANRYFDFPNEFVTAHEDFRIVAAGNTSGGGADNVYTGRYQIDGSTLDRYFEMKIDYSPTIEKAITGDNGELLAFIWELRRAAKEQDIHIMVSYRSIVNIIEMEAAGVFELDEILEGGLVKGLVAKDDLNMIIRAMAIENKNKYYQALKKCA